MRVHIEHRLLALDAVDIWIYDRSGKWSTVARVDENGRLDVEWTEDAMPEGQLPENPTLRLPREVLEELVRAAEGHVHAGDATVKHLDDTVKVRDRLLALIERGGLT